MYETRLVRVFAIFAGCLGLLALRAFTLQVVQRDQILVDHEKRVRGRLVLAPHRGDVLWADGTAAATDAPGFSVEIDPRAFEATRWRCGVCGAVAAPREEPRQCPECGSAGSLSRAASAGLGELARLLGVPPEQLEAGFERATQEHARAPQYRWHTLLDRVGRDAAVALALAGDRFPGVVPHAKMDRETDPAAAAVVGTARPAYPEDVAELRDPARSERGERVYCPAEVFAMQFGKSGLEAVFDDRLRGAPGISYRRPRARGGRVREPQVKIPVTDGAALATTLARELQGAANEIVASASGDAAAVVIDLTDGAVVAIASRSQDGLDHAVSGLRPGSVFKLVTALALLESGVSPEECVCCAGRGLLASGRRYVCDKSHGALSFSDAFAESCNAYFATMAERVGTEAMLRACRELGLDGNPRLHLTGSPCGLERTSTQGSRWYQADLARIGIGQGKALVSPLQVALAYGRVATGGRQLVPYLVADEMPGAAQIDPSIARFAPLLRAAARRVVTSGTGSGVPELQAIESAGKSGTGDVTSADRGLHNAWFVAYAPASSPRYVAAVVFERVPTFGAETVGRHVARLLAEAMK